MDNLCVQADQSQSLYVACSQVSADVTIRFVSLLLPLTACYTLLSWWELRSTLKVFIIHLFGCVPFHLVNHSHLYRAMSTLPVPPSPDYTLKPWGQTPFTPQPLSLISLMHGLLYINPPILKRRISILLGRGWLRRDQRASGLSALLKGSPTCFVEHNQFTSDS